MAAWASASRLAGAVQAGPVAKFGTLGINFRARKPRTQTEWEAELARLACQV